MPLGDECLIFHWKGDMLLTTRAKLTDLETRVSTEDDKEKEKLTRNISEKGKEWVSFVLQAREDMPFDLDQLCRFLVKSVTFTTNVHSISLFVNDTKLLQVTTTSQLEKRRGNTTGSHLSHTNYKNNTISSLADRR